MPLRVGNREHTRVQGVWVEVECLANFYPFSPLCHKTHLTQLRKSSSQMQFKTPCALYNRRRSWTTTVCAIVTVKYPNRGDKGRATNWKPFIECNWKNKASKGFLNAVSNGYVSTSLFWTLFSLGGMLHAWVLDLGESHIRLKLLRYSAYLLKELFCLLMNASVCYCQ